MPADAILNYLVAEFVTAAELGDLVHSKIVVPGDCLLSNM